jgi:hypothetical protein
MVATDSFCLFDIDEELLLVRASENVSNLSGVVSLATFYETSEKQQSDIPISFPLPDMTLDER